MKLALALSLASTPAPRPAPALPAALAAAPSLAPAAPAAAALPPPAAPLAASALAASPAGEDARPALDALFEGAQAPGERYDRELSFSVSFARDDGTTMTVPAYRIQHRLKPGSGKGGIRWHPAVDKPMIARLSEEMTQKTAVLDLPLGGAKGGVRVDPSAFSAGEQARLMRAYVGRLFELDALGWDKDVPAPDVGTNETHMAVFMDEYLRLWLARDAAAAARYPALAALRPDGAATPVLDGFMTLARGEDLRRLAVVTGKPVGKGGVEGRGEATGRGVMIAAREAALRLWGRGLQGLTVSIQGFGNVGLGSARAFAAAGAKIVAISDKSGLVFDEKGLDVAALEAHHKKHGALAGFAGGTFSADGSGIFDRRADVFVPAALENALTAETAARLNAKLVVEGANGPTTPAGDAALARRGIAVVPDILANSNGVLVSWLEETQAFRSAEKGRWTPFTLDEVRRASESMLVARAALVFDEAARRGLSWRAAALAIAARRALG